MKHVYLFLLASFSIFLSGCNETTTVGTEVRVDPIPTSYTEVRVERGPLYYATVEDANGKRAIALERLSNVYSFTSPPVLPIRVSGGYVDVDNNGILDDKDVVLDINMSSMYNIVSPITTFLQKYPNDAESIKKRCGISDEDVGTKVPSTTSVNAIKCSNALYLALREDSRVDSADFNATFAKVETSYDAIKHLSLGDLSIELEQNLTKDLNISLDANDTTKIGTLLGKLDLNNSTFARNKKSTDDISDIWNIALEIPKDSNVSKFDIGVHIVKSSGTIGNIVISGISIKDNQLTAPDSVKIFGEKESGSSSSVVYGYTHDITKKSVSLVQENLLLLDLGHIIKEQDVVGASSFSSVADYSVKLYISTIDINATKITSDKSLKITHESNFIFPTGSQEISGNIVVGQ